MLAAGGLPGGGGGVGLAAVSVTGLPGRLFGGGDD